VIITIITTLILSGIVRPPKTGIAEKIPATRLRTRAKKITSLGEGKGSRGNI
jgi:hypothetical protein